ncbi:NAD-dependent epimerase/dehydratase family protein [Actinomadura sp. J1-007]|nr:NAD-dependent epimerase/dehydratase family protein [Actinomadura sp. J1-007]
MVLTGAAGRVGAVLREPLGRVVRRLVLVDRVEMSARGTNEEVRQGAVEGVEDAMRVVEGADAIVHLAGVSDEAPLESLLDGNVLGTHHMLEAARRTGVRRVVLASSNRLTGFYPADQEVSVDMPVRPDGLYGVSKAAVEALGRLYADKFGTEVVCLRIGSMEAEPTEPRHLSTWLSPRDCAGFVEAALTVEGVGFLAVYAVSANTRRFWELDERIGYVPQDDAERFAPAEGASFEGPQGGGFASAEFTIRHGRLGG